MRRVWCSGRGSVEESANSFWCTFLSHTCMIGRCQRDRLLKQVRKWLNTPKHIIGLYQATTETQCLELLAYPNCRVGQAPSWHILMIQMLASELQLVPGQHFR